MRKALALPIFLVTLLVAGCTDPTAPDVDDDASPMGPGLADALASYNAGNASANLHRLAQLDVGGSEIDACGHLLFTDSGTAVDIVDVSDVAAPTLVGSFTAPASIEDVKVSDDCQWLFIGNDEEGSNPEVHDQGLPTGAPVGDGGFYVVDVSDPSAPALVSSLGVGPRRGPHMVYYHNTTAGQELVFGANADISINAFNRASGTLTELSRYQANIVTEFNRDPQVVDALYQGWAHDMFVMEDPVEDRTMVYVANWDAGLRILDLSDPSNPVELDGWNAFPDGHEGNLHTVATQWIGDRRITVGTVEVGFYVVGGYHYAMGTDRSILYVWDTTDATDIQLIGTWENPAGEPAGRDAPVVGEGITSTHNFQLEDGRVYLAHYGLGVFVLDVSTPDNQAAPKLLAFHKEPGDNVWDIVLNDGVIYTSGTAGVLALHYAPDIIGPSGIDSRA